MKTTARILFLFVGLFLFSEVKCPEHGYASCYNTGEYKSAADGHGMHKYNCSCGDSWWVRD
jgi:hypothetical protein